LTDGLFNVISDPDPGHAGRRYSMGQESLASGTGKNPSGIETGFILSINIYMAFVFLTLAVFMVFRESRIIKNDFINYCKRETDHLSFKAARSIGFEELTLADYVNDLKKQDSILYAFILNNRNEVLYFFDRRGQTQGKTYSYREQFNDPVKRDIDTTRVSGIITELEYKDKDSGGKIYDFSMALTSGLKSQAGTGIAITGFSDRHVNRSIRASYTVIFTLSLLYFIISVFIIKFLVVIHRKKQVQKTDENISPAVGG